MARSVSSKGHKHMHRPAGSKLIKKYLKYLWPKYKAEIDENRKPTRKSI